jgi:predicted metal-dependent hydrolase
MRNQPILSLEELEGRLDEFYQALDEFNDWYFFESHETLEDLWMVTPWPERQFFQGVIQLAAAFVHHARGEYAGTMKLLDAASAKVGEVAPDCLGVDVAALLREIERAKEELAALGEERFLEWDTARIPRIRFHRPAPRPVRYHE